MTRELSPELILKAYAMGVFPMAERRDSTNVMWLSPEKRGVLPLDALHIPNSLKKTLKQNKFHTSMNMAFPLVIKACATPRDEDGETWINKDIEDTFIELHYLGFAMSVETWRQGELVGGLYGLKLGRVFFGESMFHTKTNASKVALVNLVSWLKKNDFSLLDTQFITAHLRKFGAQEISRPKYLRLLHESLYPQHTTDGEE